MKDLTRVSAGVYAYRSYRIEGRSRRWYWRNAVAFADVTDWAGPFANLKQAVADLRGRLGEEEAE